MVGAGGWDALSQWGDDAVRLERFTRGVANDVLECACQRATCGWPTRYEAHVDVADLDLVLPHNAAGLDV